MKCFLTDVGNEYSSLKLGNVLVSASSKQKQNPLGEVEKKEIQEILS